MSGRGRVRPMPPAIASLTTRLFDAAGAGRAARVGVPVALHLAALAVMLATESDARRANAAFVLTWGLLNFCWLAAAAPPGARGGAVARDVRRADPAVAVQVRRSADDGELRRRDDHRHGHRRVPVDDVPEPRRHGRSRSCARGVPLGADLAVRSASASGGARRSPAPASASAGLTALSLRVPIDLDEEFLRRELRVEVRALRRRPRSAICITRGFLESDAAVSERLAASPATTLRPARKPPHIVMVHDELSFDMRARSRASRCRPATAATSARSTASSARFVVEGAGGPSWYTEYNVLTGLSARSYGRFADFVTRIAAGRVERGLPHALRRCGYKTFTLYPWTARSSARAASSQTAGIEQFPRRHAARRARPRARQLLFRRGGRLIARERGTAPLFLFVYTAANHFPWDCPLPPRSDAGLARSRQPRRASTSICAGRT